MKPIPNDTFTGQVAAYFTVALLAGPDGGYEVHVGAHGDTPPDYVDTGKPFDIAAVRTETPIEAITMSGAMILHKLQRDGFHGIEMAQIEADAHAACEKHGVN